MPRARRDQENFSRSRPGQTKITPPRIQNGTADTSAQTQQLGSSTNSTSAGEQNASLAPLLLGAGTFPNATSIEKNSDNEKRPITNLLTENKDLLPSSTLTDQAQAGLLASVVNDNNGNSNMNQVVGRPNGLSTLFSQWTKKSDGAHSMDVSITAPLWMQTYETFSLTKAVAAAQALPGEEIKCHSNK